MTFYRILGVVVLFCFITADVFAQRGNRNTANTTNPVEQNSLSDRDLIQFKFFFHNGLKEKILGNPAAALQNFLRCVDIDPKAHAAYFEIALIYTSNADYPKALSAINKAIEFYKKEIWYYTLQAEIYNAARDYANAALALSNAIALNPSNVELYFNKALNLELANKPTEALQEYIKIEQLTGINEQTLLQKQKLYVRAGQYENAIADLEKIIALNPNDVRFYFNLADIYDLWQKPDKQFETYKRALKISPDDGFIQLLIANYQLNKGDKASAFQALKTGIADPAIAHEEKLRIIYSTYFKDYANRDKTEEQELIQILAKAHPDEPRVLAIYGDILLEAQEYEKASAQYEKVLVLDKQTYAYWEQMVRLQLIAGNFAKAESFGDDALTYFPNQALLYLFTGIAKNQNKNYQSAISILRNGLSLSIGNNELRLEFFSGLGDAYHNIENHVESDKAFEEALKINPDYSLVLNNYAYYLSVRGKNLARAEEMSRRSNELVKDNAAYLDTYAWILYKLGKYNEALVWMEKAIAADTNNSATLAEHYGDILYKLGRIEEAHAQWVKAKDLGLQSKWIDKKINDKKLYE